MKRQTFYRLLFVHILFISLQCNAQNDTIYRYENEMEQLIEYSDEGTSKNYDDDIIELHERFREPVNINIVNKSILQQFSFLSDVQIEHILAYLYLHGEMQTIYELQLVPDMDWQTIRYMSAFFCAKPVGKKELFPSLKMLLKWGKSEVTTRLDIPFYRTEGYKNKYLGNPYYHAIRYTYHYRDRVYAGLTAEKDKGEVLFASYNRKGYDSYSFYVLIKDLGLLKTLAIGDYRLSFGQGLVLSHQFTLGKSTYMSTLNRRINSIRKHASTDEFNYFRGAAASFDLGKHWLLTTFLSYRQLDGTIKDNQLTSINKSGLHRTQTEVDHSNAFGLFCTGGNINHVADKWQTGITAIYYRFSYPYMPIEHRYNQYALRGSTFYNISTDYSYRYRRFSFSGETAIGSRGVATLNRILYSPSQGYNILLLHRYYAHNYWAYFAHSFSSSSAVQNENGWYVAADMKLFSKWSFFVSTDLVSFPWCRYRISKASKAADIMLRASYMPKRFNMDFNYRYRSGERDITGTQGTQVQSTYQHAFKYRCRYDCSNNIQIGTIMDYKYFKQEEFNSNVGYQITQHAAYTFHCLPLNVSVQGSYFNVDNYDSRVYIYERGLLYACYIPAYQGTGLHLSLRFQYQLCVNCMLITHMGMTHYYHQDVIGSGNDRINSNRRIDLQLQLRWKI